MKRLALTSIRGSLATVLLAFAACGGAVERTAPASDGQTAAGADVAITRVTFGSCAFQWAEQPIFRPVVAAEPDLYLSLGDAICYRVAGPFVDLNFGLVEVDWDARPYPVLPLEVMDENRGVAFEQAISLDVLQP